MTGTTKRSLFGGALLAAGMVAPTVHAQNLSFQYSDAATAAYDYPNKAQYHYQVFSGSGPFSISASVDGASSAIEHNSAGMFNKANSAHKGFIGGGYTIFSYFQSDTTGNLNLNWDFSADVQPGGNFFDSRLDIYDVTGGFANIFHADLNNPIGNQQLAVTAGNQYALVGLTIALGGAGSSHYEVTIPAPGSAGLLGIAGLVAARRRR